MDFRREDLAGWAGPRVVRDGSVAQGQIRLKAKLSGAPLTRAHHILLLLRNYGPHVGQVTPESEYRVRTPPEARSLTDEDARLDGARRISRDSRWPFPGH